MAVVDTLCADDQVNVNLGSQLAQWTPLRVACHEGHAKVVAPLAANPHVELNAVNEKDGVSPLAAACKQGHADVVSTLLSVAGPASM